MLKLFLVLFFVLVVSLVGVNDVFGINAGEEYTPTQPNALASYNNINNQITVTWDFDNLPVDTTTCLLKGDFVWQEDLNRNFNVTPAQNELNNVFDKSTSFIPLQYSTVSPTPITINSTTMYTEIIPCTNGNMRIDIDTIMNHSLNINNYKDLQIFLTFYVANSNGGFSSSLSFRIDEVFVFYTPDDTWSNNAKTWACGGQIGSVLYIDQSGIHGNNGDNCDKYLVLDPFQWVEIQMYGSSNPTPKGTPSYDFHDGLSTLLFKVGLEPTQQEENKKNGGGNESKTRPTFGIGHEVPSQLVNCGFKYDEKCYDIINNWHTDFNSTEIKTGETHTFTQKAYFPKIMKLMGFNLGIAEIGKGYDSELQIDVSFDYQGNITHIELNQDSDIIDSESLQIHNFKVACDETDTQKKCDAVSYTMRFLEPLQYDIMAMQGIDQKNREQWTYLNEGFPVTGKSLNPMKTDNIMGTEKYEGLIKVTQKEKYGDIWIAEDGREFERNSFGSFTQINQTFERKTTPEQSVMNRIHSEYYILVDAEKLKAQKTLEKICPHCNDESFDKLNDLVYGDISLKLDRINDPELQRAIIAEQQRALEYLQSHRQ